MTSAPTDLPRKHTPLREYPAPSTARLTIVELRKTLDTRAGRWLLLVVLSMAAAGLAYRLLNADESPVGYEDFYGTALTAVQQVLPLLGVLAMTSEWTQRTALATFTLVPRRGRVLLAKLTATVILTTCTTVIIGAVSAGAAAVSGVVTDQAVVWGDVAAMTSGAVAAFVLSMLMGAGMGALLQQTPAAMAVYFIAPALVTTVAAAVLEEKARWVDLYAALGHVSELDPAVLSWPTAVALSVWIAMPLVAGVLRSLRREVQ